MSAIRLLALALVGLAPGTALAAPVVEIDQQKALAGGVTRSDAPGFPVTIDRRGSYVLTSNLTVPDAGTTAIDIRASKVNLDLGGFTIQGPVACKGVPAMDCAPAGKGDGIHSARDTEQVAIRYGFVKGMGDDGVELLGYGSMVQSVKAMENGDVGLRINNHGSVLESAAERNGGHGVEAGGFAKIRNTRSYGNGGTGIKGKTQSDISECISYKNGEHGFTAGLTASFVRNSAYDNRGDGIKGGTATSARANTVNFNGGWGIRLGRSGRYGENQISGNSLGTVEGGLDEGSNLCNSKTSCP